MQTRDALIATVLGLLLAAEPAVAQSIMDRYNGKAPAVVLPPRPPGFKIPQAEPLLTAADCAIEKVESFRLKACTAVIEKEPTAAWAYHVRSTAYRERRNADAAFADANKAIELDPKLAGARIERANYYSFKGQYDLAIADAKIATELAPLDRRGHALLGSSYEKTGNRDGMLAAYKTTLSLFNDPKTVADFNGRGWYNLKIGKPAIGLLEVDKALALDPKHAASRDTRGQILAAMERTEEAVDELRVALSLAPFMKASKDALARIKPTEFVTAELKGRKFMLPVPPGYCAVGSASVLERKVHAVYKGIHEKGGADLLLLAMRCRDVAQLRKGQPLASFDRIMSITTFKLVDIVVGPVTPQQRTAFVQQRARGVGALNVEDVTRFANKASEGIATSDPSKTRMRVVEVTGTAAYTAFAGRSTPATGGAASNDSAITGITLIEGVPMLVKIGGGEYERNPHEDLLIDAKVAIALLLDVKAE
jgi:tetratricopeptide (TPR) repeat protein